MQEEIQKAKLIEERDGERAVVGSFSSAAEKLQQLVAVHDACIFVQTISIAPLQVHYYSDALPTQHGYCARISCRSATGNCELRTCPRILCGG